MGPTIECHDYLIAGATLPLRRPLMAILRMAAFKKNASRLHISCSGALVFAKVGSRRSMPSPGCYDSLRQSCIILLAFPVYTVIIGNGKVLLADKIYCILFIKQKRFFFFFFACAHTSSFIEMLKEYVSSTNSDKQMFSQLT